MANSALLAPFILKAEGGYVNNPSDKGSETNRGITYTTFQKYFGTDHDRFMKMTDEDWGVIFHSEYWNKALADKINDQRIANIIVDWVFNSGQYSPEKDTQILIDTVFGKHLAADGIFGQQTIDTLNSVNQDDLYKDLIVRRQEFYDSIVDEAHERNDYSQDQFLQGWKNRILNLVKYNLSFVRQS